MRLRPSVLFAAVLLLAACDTTGPEVTTEPPSRPANPLYSESEVAYFVEVALGDEFGGSSPQVRRWGQDVRIAVRGAPTAQDLATLDAVVSDLNALIEPVEVSVVTERPTVTLRFLHPDEFAGAEPNYVAGNLGFFYVNWTGACQIYRANILIATEGVTQAERSHLIREEVTQSMGLMRDSDRYPESIFYQPWTSTTSYAAIDRTLIEMLYRLEIEPCLGRAEARRRLLAISADG